VIGVVETLMYTIIAELVVAKYVFGSHGNGTKSHTVVYPIFSGGFDCCKLEFKRIMLPP